MKNINLNNTEIVTLTQNELVNITGGSNASAEAAGEAAGVYVRNVIDGALALGAVYAKWLELAAE